ncbi:MAG: adenylate cyclase [Clostridiales bacterium]|nr:adenylate cyclase [Clostridiales bacterium]
MGGNIRSTNLRFNLDKPLQRRAWEYLQTMDKRAFKSYSQAIAVSLVNFFERYYKTQSDPYLETREREERFVAQIVAAVERAMERVLPGFLAAYLAGWIQPYQVQQTFPSRPGHSQNEDAVAAEQEVGVNVDWDFLGG